MNIEREVIVKVKNVDDFLKVYGLDKFKKIDDEITPENFLIKNFFLKKAGKVTCGLFSNLQIKRKNFGVEELFGFLDNPELIPKDWGNKRIFFPGTVFWDKDGDPFILFLYKEKREFTFGRCYHYHVLDDGDFFVSYNEFQHLISEGWTEVYQGPDEVLLEKDKLRILFNKKGDYIHLKFEVISVNKIKLIEY